MDRVDLPSTEYEERMEDENWSSINNVARDAYAAAIADALRVVDEI